MTTKDILKQMEKEFDEKFPGDVATMEEDGIHARITSSLYNRDSIKSFIRESIRTLLESFGEEILKTKYKCGWRHDEEGVEYDMCDECRAVDEYRAEQRLKVKEILSNLK